MATVSSSPGEQVVSPSHSFKVGSPSLSFKTASPPTSFKTRGDKESSRTSFGMSAAAFGMSFKSAASFKTFGSPDEQLSSSAAWKLLGVRQEHLLDLSDRGLVGDAFMALCDGQTVAYVQGLVLSSNELADDGLLALTNACSANGTNSSIGGPAFGRLRWLDVANNQITDEGVLALASAGSHGWLSSLRGIMLSNNRVGDKGVEALAEVCASRTAFGELKTLSLDGNIFTDVGVAGLGKACASHALTVIKLEGFSIPVAKLRATGVGSTDGDRALSPPSKGRMWRGGRKRQPVASAFGLHGEGDASAANGQTSFNWSCEAITDRDVLLLCMVLRSHRRNSTIETLNLAANNIGLEGIRHLCTATLRDGALPALRELTLTANQDIELEGCNVLARALENGAMPSLQLLYVDTTHMYKSPLRAVCLRRGVRLGLWLMPAEPAATTAPHVV